MVDKYTGIEGEFFCRHIQDESEVFVFFAPFSELRFVA